MKGVINVNKRGNTKTSVYVIDSDFRIVYSNNELTEITSREKQSPYCYEIIGNEHGQCQRCPLRAENEGKSILFDCLHNEWISVTAAPIEFPGAGACHLILTDSMESCGKSVFYNTASRSDYDELLELNYTSNTYSVVYHGERMRAYDNRKGNIRDTIYSIAEKQIHPEDRQRFYDFWLIDRIGSDDVPEELLITRHAEFRKLRSDGGYRWVQQVLMPVRKSSKNEIFVNSFFNTIEAPYISVEETENDQFFDKNEFFKRAEETLRQSEAGVSWCMLAVDIEKLKLFNEWYGRQAGDSLLSDIVDCIKKFQEQLNGVAGYFENDDFALLVPYDEAQIDLFYQAITSLIKSHSGKINVLPAIGIYEIIDKKTPAFKAYDRANLACTAVKGNYIDRIKKFDQKMLDKLESEYLLFSDIQKAFQNKEFTFVLQPKCHMKSGNIVGAEALARWNSREKGVISPGVFIPFLEKSGYIAELDIYIWEEVCKWLRRMLDSGFPVVPVSVNVSRADLYSVDVPAYFDSLIQKYDLSPKLIEIEITESAYIDDHGVINQTITKLHESGFRILMDDFGSAYSSLNMLKDISVDVLKIDMRFLNMDVSNTGKGLDILETVCNMASILGLGIIVEGVETEEQRNYLLTMKCIYGQGYYFYRPLSTDDFEEKLRNNVNDHAEEVYDENNERLYLKDLLSQDIFSEIMINNMLGAVAFYDVYDGQINVTRYNEQYATLIGNETFTSETSIRSGEELYQEDFMKMFQMFDDAQKNRHLGAELDVRRCRPDGTDMWLHMRTFFLHKQNGHAVYYSSVSDVTKMHRANEALKFLNNDMPGGYYRHANNADCDFIHISERFLNIFGFTREEIEQQFDNKFMNMVHPEDRATVLRSITAMEQNGGNYSQPYRMRSKNGYILVVDQSRLIRYQGTEFFQGIILYDLDRYKWMGTSSDEVSQKDAVMQWGPCGIFQSEADGGHSFEYVSDSMLTTLGYSRREFLKKFDNCTENLVYAEDRARISEEIAQQINEGQYVSCEYRIEMADGSLKWFYSYARLLTDTNGKRWFYTCITDCDYLKEKYQVQEWQYLKYKSLAQIPGMIVYDYDPDEDRLAVEMSLENGTTETFISERYLERIESNGSIADECVDEQKRRLQTALLSPINGITEFKARFFEGQGYQWYRFYYQSLADENGRVYRLVGRAGNINKEIESISEWKARATKDTLTGLLNYEAAKEKAISLFEKKGGLLYLLDLDNFKAVNDQFGHLDGDALLKRVADIIRDIFHTKDIAARFGGDEFIVFISGKHDMQSIRKKAQEFLDEIAKIALPNDKTVQCSIGVAVSYGNSIPFEELFRRADTALYQSKRSGKNRFTVWVDETSKIGGGYRERFGHF